MKVVIRVIKILISLLVVFFLLNFIYSLVMVGSHPYAEQYILNVSEDEAINEIEKLKRRELSLKVPIDDSSFGELSDGKSENFYYTYFFLKDKKSVVLCYVKRINETTTTFALISVGDGPNFLNSRTINARKYFLLRDLSEEDNRKFKQDLEEQVLDKLGIKWKKNKWW